MCREFSFTVVLRRYQYRTVRSHLVIPREFVVRGLFHLFLPRLSRFNLSTSGSIGLFEALRVTHRAHFAKPVHGLAFARKATTDGTLLVCFRFLPGSAPSHPPVLPPARPFSLLRSSLFLSSWSHRQEGTLKRSPVCVHAETVSDFVSRFLRALRECSRSQ